MTRSPCAEAQALTLLLKEPASAGRLSHVVPGFLQCCRLGRICGLHMQTARSAGDQTRARRTRKAKLKNPRAQGGSSQPQGGLEALLEGKVGSRQGGLSAGRQAGRQVQEGLSFEGLPPSWMLQICYSLEYNR